MIAKFLNFLKKLFSPSMLIFPFLLFYFEVIFLASTTGTFTKANIIFTLLFSIAYGLITYILVAIFKKRWKKTLAVLIFVAVPTIIYLIEYFVYHYFKVFYDINTVVGGAGDTVGGFSTEIYKLIFSYDGIFKILLFFLPTILISVFLDKLFSSHRKKSLNIATSVVSAIVVYTVSISLILSSQVYRPIYRESYNFQSAAEQFGLITALRLDLQYTLLGHGQNAFEHSNTSDTVRPSVEPVDYGYNQLEIDFKSGKSEVIQNINDYVSSLTPSKKNSYTGIFKGKNLVMISAEAFSAEVIDPTLTPTLYRLATKGVNFTDYYQPDSAGTTGGEYQNLFGMLPTSGGMSFKETIDNLNYFTMGNQLNRLGYYGAAYHNNTYTYYSRNKTHNNLGYSEGFMGFGNGMEKYVKSTWPQSDLEMVEGTLPLYIEHQPFNIYYMSVSGHSNYNRVGNYITRKNWDKVKDLPFSDTIKGYLAANLELEYALKLLVSELENRGIAENTVICISADHFPYGLDEKGNLGEMPYLSELYGYNVTDLFMRDHSRLILWCGSLEKDPPIIIDTPTSSLDILPTLSNLFGTEYDSRLLVGRDVFSDAMPLVFNTTYDWKTDVGTYYANSNRFVPKNQAVNIPDDYINIVNKTVRNKIRYCEQVLKNDYFAHLFG